MKQIKTKLFLTLLLLSTLTKAQFIDLGIKGGIGTTMPLSQNIIESVEGYSIFSGYKPSYTYGAKLGLNFTPKYSIVAEYNLSNINPFYSSTIIEVPRFVFHQIPVLFKFNSDNGSFTEIGSQLSILKSSNIDLSNFLKRSYDIVIGGGQYIGGGSAFGTYIGIRAIIPVQDFNNKNVENPGYSTFTPSTPNFYQYSAFRNVTILITAEFNINFGYFTQGPNCHPGTRFKLF